MPILKKFHETEEIKTNFWEERFKKIFKNEKSFVQVPETFKKKKKKLSGKYVHFFQPVSL